MKRVIWAVSMISATFPALGWCQIGNIVVTDAASFQVGMPSKGSIGTVFCTGLSVQGTISAPGFPLPTSLAGVMVSVDGAAAPLFAVADLGLYQQINFQVPVDTATAHVVVSQNDSQGSTTATNDPHSPGELFRIGGTQSGIFQHATDYSLVTADNPAKAGETLVAYATGLPLAIPQVPIGQPAPSSPLTHVPQMAFGNAIDRLGLSVNSSILLFDTGLTGDTTGELPIPFMGLTPGAAGLYQINFVLPQGIPAGNVTIQIVREICITPFGGCGAPHDIQYYSSQPVLIPVR